jgi:hypothetical protein
MVKTKKSHTVVRENPITTLLNLSSNHRVIAGNELKNYGHLSDKTIHLLKNDIVNLTRQSQIALSGQQREDVALSIEIINLILERHYGIHRKGDLYPA